jgi:hypothetical protein
VLSSILLNPGSAAPSLENAHGRRLTEADAIDIWIARWLRIRRVDLVRRYGCDPRRLYEIWEERRFAGSRDKALELFKVRYPTLLGRADYGRHRRISQGPDPSQLSFFEQSR